VTDRPPVVNVANGLTVLRLLLVPVFLYLLLAQVGLGWRLAACLVFVLAAVTDQIDGHLARRHHLVTDFGRMADPLADKALVGAALIGLSVLDELPWWVTVVVLVREIAVSVLRFVVIRHRVIAATKVGKVKTMAQLVALTLWLLPLPVLLADLGFSALLAWVEPVRWVVLCVALVLTVGTGVDYFVRALGRGTRPT
jgi:CDP-diacylglycerol--glycerol-3-phosphate 3-phosphatidyltransferase